MKKVKRVKLNPVAKSFSGEHGAVRRTQVHRSKKKYTRKDKHKNRNNYGSFFLL